MAPIEVEAVPDDSARMALSLRQDVLRDEGGPLRLDDTENLAARASRIPHRASASHRLFDIPSYS